MSPSVHLCSIITFGLSVILQQFTRKVWTLSCSYEKDSVDTSLFRIGQSPLTLTDFYAKIWRS